MTDLHLPTGPSELDHSLLQRHRFALVAAEHIERLDSGLPRVRIVPPGMGDSESLMPLLVNLALLDVRQHAMLLDELQRAHASLAQPVFSALLATEADSPRIEAHLAHAQLRSAVNGRRAWLRLHDPRVWAQLPRILRSSELRKLFGPVSAWSICMHGHWIATVPPPLEAHSTAASDAQTPASIWAALERVGLINRVLSQCGWLGYEEAVQHSPRVDALLLRGQQRHGLSSLDDLVDYASLGARVHPCFDAHPIAIAAVKAERLDAPSSSGSQEADNSYVVHALRAVPREDWERVRAELDASDH